MPSEQTLIFLSTILEALVLVFVGYEVVVGEARHRRTMSSLTEVSTPSRRISMRLGLFIVLISSALWATVVFGYRAAFPPETPAAHYLTTADSSDPSLYEGRPLGVWWASEYLELASVTMPGSVIDVRATGYLVRARNLGSEEVNLRSATMVSGIDSTQIQMKISAIPGGFILPEEAAPIPPGAEFAFHAQFGNGPSGLSESEFMKEWATFSVVIQTDNQKIRREFPADDIRAQFNRNHPERAPLVTRRATK
jgi:hypothetical protein